MLRDNFFNRLFNSELRENGVTRSVTNAPDAPETTVEHADNGRGISIDDIGLLRAEDDTVPAEPGLTFSDISHRVWDMPRTWTTLREARNSCLYHDTVIDRAPEPFRMDDRLEILEKLKKAIADMVSRREQAFRDIGCTDNRLIDYGHNLAELFRELYPDLYRNAIESAKHIQETRITTDN